jgi:hypothetical protein
MSVSNADPKCSFRRAIENNDSKTVLNLIQNKSVNPSMRGNEAFKVVCEKGFFDIAVILLSDSRVDPSVDDNYPILTASEYGYTLIVRCLLQDARFVLFYDRIDPPEYQHYQTRPVLQNLSLA